MTLTGHIERNRDREIASNLPTDCVLMADLPVVGIDTKKKKEYTSLSTTQDTERTVIYHIAHKSILAGKYLIIRRYNSSYLYFLVLRPVNVHRQLRIQCFKDLFF